MKESQLTSLKLSVIAFKEFSSSETQDVMSDRNCSVILTLHRYLFD